MTEAQIVGYRVARTERLEDGKWVPIREVLPERYKTYEDAARECERRNNEDLRKLADGDATG